METYVIEAKKQGERPIRAKSHDRALLKRDAERLRAKGWKAHVYRVGGHNESGCWWGWNGGEVWAIPNPLLLPTA